MIRETKNLLGEKNQLVYKLNYHGGLVTMK
jgi:hypothetical protein